jgi:hypothetical protein
MTIHISTASTDVDSTATVTSIDNEPNVIKYTAHGSSPVTASVALARLLVEQRGDPDELVSIDAMPNIKALSQLI